MSIWSEADVERVAQAIHDVEWNCGVTDRFRRLARAALTASLSAGVVGEMREALRPLAAIADRWHEDEFGETLMTDEDGISLADCRRARAILARLDGNGGGT